MSKRSWSGQTEMRRRRSAGTTVLLALIASCSESVAMPADVACDPMVYQSGDVGDEDIWVLEGDEVRRLTGSGARDFNPDWSPDGRRSAFTTGVGSDFDLAMMSPDGSDVEIVWDGGSELWASSADWSADGAQLVFDAFGLETPLQVFRVDADGSDQSQLTSDGINGKPVWTPSGESILYLHLSDEYAVQEIHLMSSDGAEPMNISQDRDHRDVLAEMSPNGDLIAFRSDRSGDAEIWLMGGDGSDPRLLVELAGTDSNPTWSSDGRHVLFTHEEDGRPPSVWVVGRNGEDVREIFTAGWVPDCP